MDKDLPLPTDPVQKAAPDFREWIVALGLPALLLAIGVGLMGWVWFWLGAILVYVALLFFGGHWCFSARKRRAKIPGAIATLIGLVVFSCYVFWTYPLRIQTYIAGGGYSEGQVSGGITWGPALGDARLTLSNPSDIDYTDFDVFFEVGQEQSELPQIMQIVEQSTIPNVSFTSQPFGPNHIHIHQVKINQTIQLEGLGSDGSFIYGKDGKGAPLKIPALTGPMDPSPIFRIQFDKLPPHTDLKIIAAVAITNPPDSLGRLPKQPLTEFTKPACMWTWGTYKARNRSMSIRDVCH